MAVYAKRHPSKTKYIQVRVVIPEGKMTRRIRVPDEVPNDEWPNAKAYVRAQVRRMKRIIKARAAQDALDAAEAIEWAKVEQAAEAEDTEIDEPDE